MGKEQYLYVQKINGERLMFPVKHYLLHTYIVTSKPKRISVADGVVHIMLSFLYRFCYKYNYTLVAKNERQWRISLW